MKLPRLTAEYSLGPALHSYTAAPSETMLSVSGLLMRVAVVSALVLTVLIAANVAMLRVLG